MFAGMSDSDYQGESGLLHMEVRKRMSLGVSLSVTMLCDKGQLETTATLSRQDDERPRLLRKKHLDHPTRVKTMTS